MQALRLRRAVLEQMALNAGLFGGVAQESTPLDAEVEPRLRGLGDLGQQ